MLSEGNADRASRAGQHELGLVSVVIPTYRSGEWIAQLCNAVAGVLRSACSDFEIILVDDASPDATWGAIQRAAAGIPEIRALRLMRNEGQATATLCGLGAARGEVVLTMDDDFQHVPEEILTLLGALRTDGEVDCVFGHFVEKEHAWYRNVASRVIGALNRRALGMPRGIRTSAFRAMRGQLARAIASQPTANPSLTALIASNTSRLTSIVVRHAPRRSGRSNYSLAKQFRLALDGVYSSTLVPLRLLSIFGSIIFVGTVAASLYYIAQWSVGNVTVSGWTAIVLVELLAAGAILLGLGILGEYMGRLMRDTRQRPMYLVRDAIR